MKIEDIITRFNGAKPTPQGYKVCCPAHDDSTASLVINRDTGKTLVRCFAGCSTVDVLARVGLTLTDLFDEPLSKRERTKAPPNTPGSHGKEVARYRYTDVEGNHLYDVVRYHPKTFKQCIPDASQPNGVKWGLNGVKRVLYLLPYVAKYASTGEPIFITEGEKDANNILKQLTLFATTGGGASQWQPNFTEALLGAHVVILPDNDDPGRQHAQVVARALYGSAASVRILPLPDLPLKGDVSDWIEAGGTREQLLQLAKDCQLYEPEPDSISANITATDISGENFTTILSEAGNAWTFARQHGDDIRRVFESKKWIRWTGKVWKTDHLGEVRCMAERTIRNQFMWLPNIKDMAQFDSYSKWLRSSLSLAKLDAMIELAATQQHLGIMSEDIDRDDWTLNCNNGTLDLRTGTLNPHCKTDMNTRMVNINYDPEADCTRWEQFVYEIFDGDRELIAYVQRALGYTLTGDTREQCFFILNGNGANGKSTLINAVREIFGEYHTKTATETLLKRQQGTATNDLAALDGARFVSAMEVDAQRHLAEALVKELVGGDPISARFLYQESKTFMPKLKLWMACNHMPKVDGQDDGIWRRIKIIPFAVMFSHREDANGKCKPPYRDGMLPDKLRMEYPGILSWMMRGCLDWQAHGLGRCTAVDGATAIYKTDQDLLSEFFEDECHFNVNADIRGQSLYTVYQTWAERSGLRSWPYKTFISKLKEHNTINVSKRKDGTYFLGITTKDSVDINTLGDDGDGNSLILQTPHACREYIEVYEKELFSSPASPEHENQPKTSETVQIGDANINQHNGLQNEATTTTEQNDLFRAAALLNYPSISYTLDYNGEPTLYGIPANETAWKNQSRSIINNGNEKQILAVKTAIRMVAKQMAQQKGGNQNE